jgi:short subunit fatty acids transporter
MAGVVLGRAVASDRPSKSDIDRHRLAAIGIVVAATVAFQALLGYYADRLSWSLAPPALAAAAILARPIDVRMRGIPRLALTGALFATVVAWVGMQAFSPALPIIPWSQMLLDPRYGSTATDRPHASADLRHAGVVHAAAGRLHGVRLSAS